LLATLAVRNSLAQLLKLPTNPFQAALIGPQVTVTQAGCGPDMNQGAFLIPVEFDIVHEAKQEGANFYVEIIRRLSNQPGPRPAAHQLHQLLKWVSQRCWYQ